MLIATRHWHCAFIKCFEEDILLRLLCGRPGRECGWRCELKFQIELSHLASLRPLGQILNYSHRGNVVVSMHAVCFLTSA